MKKIIIALTVLFAAFKIQAQTAVKQPQIPPPPDSIAFISAKDMTEFLKWLPDNVSKTKYETMKPDEVIILFYQWIVAEWRKKQKPKN